MAPKRASRSASRRKVGINAGFHLALPAFHFRKLSRESRTCAAGDGSEATTATTDATGASFFEMSLEVKNISDADAKLVITGGPGIVEYLIRLESDRLSVPTELNFTKLMDVTIFNLEKLPSSKKSDLSILAGVLVLVAQQCNFGSQTPRSRWE